MFWILGSILDRVLDSGKWLVRMSHGKVKYLSRQWGQSPLKVSFETEEQAYDKFHYADVNPFHKVMEQQINNKFTHCFPFRKYFLGTGCANTFFRRLGTFICFQSFPTGVCFPVFYDQKNFKSWRSWKRKDYISPQPITFSDMQYLSADHTMCWSWDFWE